MIMAKTPVAFLLAAVLALSVVSVLLYAQTMDLRTTNRDDVFAKFREFEIYKEFKEKYPYSVDEDRVENGLHALDSSYAEDGDKISLNILFDEESYFSKFDVVCDIDRHALQIGGAYFDAFETLHDNDCIVDDVP